MVFFFFFENFNVSKSKFDEQFLSNQNIIINQCDMISEIVFILYYSNDFFNKIV